MSDFSSPVSEVFDGKFYRDFYGLSPDEFKDDSKIYEQYHQVGKSKGRVVNKEQLNAAISKILNFNSELYSNINLSFDHKNTVLKKFKLNASSSVDHFFSAGGNLTGINRARILNDNDLIAYNNRWLQLETAVDAAVKFDMEFYANMYDIPDSTGSRRDLFLHWLTRAVFVGELPSEMYLDAAKRAHLFNDLLAVLMEAGVDVNFVMQNYMDVMAAYCVANEIVVPGALTPLQKMMFLLFNSGQKLRVFFNAAEQSAYVASNSAAYADAIAQIKADAQEDAARMASVGYSKRAAELERDKRRIVFKNAPFELKPVGALKSLKSMRTFASDSFISMFAACNKLSGAVAGAVSGAAADVADRERMLSDYVSVIAVRELKKCAGLDITSMDFKNFVLDLVYNVFSFKKIAGAAGKSEYNEFILQKTIGILSALYQSRALSGFEDVLFADIKFLIENKRILKLGKILLTIIPNLVL